MSNFRGDSTAIPPLRPGMPIRGAPGRASKGGGLLDCFVFAVPCAMFVEITVVGRLFAPEFMLLAVLPFLLTDRGRALSAPLPRTLIYLGLLWLVSQVATDLIRETPFRDLARGWAKITLTLLNFVALYLLLHDNRRRIVLFASGLVLGGILIYLFNPGEFSVRHPWKFGYGVPVTLALVLVAQGAFERNNPRIVSAVLFFAAGLNLVMGSRSFAGICFLTGVYLLLQSRRSRGRPRISFLRLVGLGVVFLVATIGFVELYGYAAQTGALGAEAQAKYQTQVSRRFGLLLGGRTEVVVALHAIADSPLIGHGSWARDKEYASLLLELQGYGPTARQMALGSAVIPSHSYIFGAWMQGGLLGAVFWGWVMLLIARVLASQYQIREQLAPLIIFVCFVLLWDVLFSPFGALGRLYATYYTVVAMFAMESARAAIHQGVQAAETS